ncbi:VOC family protein [Streptomyces sp. NPDC056723]|uniref:VOC family protein n=1 Tax=Streptomyces sp. NPDC056723 TaxID=3345925 RepID=UPI003699E7C0
MFLTTHNWGKAAKFFQALGYELEFATDHNSGRLRNGDGPSVCIAESREPRAESREPRAESREPQTRIMLKVPDADEFRLDPVVEMVTPFEDTHYGAKEMTVRDPDGRLWSLQAPAKN